MGEQVEEKASVERDEPVLANVWTVPNIVSFVRIGLIVVFGWLLIAGEDLWAIIVLALAGISDFLDGFLARRWHQVTQLGRLLDPAADRLLTAVVVVGFAIRGIIPWWLVAILLSRDLMVAIALVIGQAKGLKPPEVSFIGKTATAMLYVVLPVAFLAFERWDGIHAGAVIATYIAAGLYWAAGLGYVRDVRSRLPGAGRGESANRAASGLG
ncbi:CDP-alcohol phosphatidyltransferase family protein [Demequina sp.]|uniref:CDP-alcohol phosphatidyltransferase family protein n=1 Tax=Demequina sp. TaxID=2050685 RepID=UPI003A870BBA